MPTSLLDLSFLRQPAALKRIAAIAISCALLGLLYGLLAPKWYESVLTVVPANEQGGGLSGLLAGGALGGLAAGLTDSAGADAARIAAVLGSISVTDAVIEKFDLRSRYGAQYQESARSALWTHCAAKVLPKPRLVQLTCEDKDPRFVKEMLDYFADYGNEVFRRVSVGSASEEVRFLEAHAREVRQQADASAERMRAFGEQHQIVDIESQAKVVVEAIAAIQAQRISKQMELDYARSFSSGDEATMRQMETQLSVMDKKVRDLEEPSALQQPPAPAERRRGSRMFPAALAVPKLRAEFEGLYRDRKVAEATLVFALERLEAAKANKARETSTFQVLDRATLPTHQARPKRVVTVAVLLMLGLAGAVSLELRRSGALAPLMEDRTDKCDRAA
jgi:LPS O-antigen subunit length determinant protein (WzzB/FepE family)